MISPCRTCSLEYVDKNNDTCMRCAKLIKYCQSLDGLTCSVPVEITDMAKWEKDQTEYLRDNYQTKSDAEIAQHIGKNAASIQSKRWAIGLKKVKGCKAVGTAPAPYHDRPRDVDARQLLDAVPADVPPAKDLMLVNLKGFEELYERLKRSAQANFRPPELQAMWFIHQGLASEDGAGDQRRAPDGTS